MTDDNRDAKTVLLDDAVYIVQKLDQLGKDCLAGNDKTGEICCKLALMAIKIFISELPKKTADSSGQDPPK